MKILLLKKTEAQETAVLGASTGVMSWDDAKRLGYGVDFVQPSTELPPSRPATKEDYERVQHSVGTLADPAANIYRPWDAKLNLGSGYSNRSQELEQIAASQPPQTTNEAPQALEEPQINSWLAELHQKILEAKGKYAEAESLYRSATTEQEKVLANEMAKRAHYEANLLRAQMEDMGVAPKDCGQIILTKEVWRQKERKRENGQLFYQSALLSVDFL